MNALKEVTLPTKETIKNLIEKHRVCYEWWKEYDLIEEKRVHIGYGLRLCAINENETSKIVEGHPVPGCGVCRKTFNDLSCLARWILPKEKRESQYMIEPFDNAFHFASGARNNREEIVLTIQILHRMDVSRPAEECQNLCFQEMCRDLKKLGVLEGSVNRDFDKMPTAK